MDDVDADAIHEKTNLLQTTTKRQYAKKHQIENTV